MRAMILGAGLGTRLRPLTDRLAKPAVPFFDRPLAAHVLRHLCAMGVTDVVVNAHHLPETLERALRPFVPEGVTLEIVPEPTLLGTGGGVRRALVRQRDRLGASDAPILLINGDVLFFPDLAEALAVHRRTGAAATMVVRSDPRAEAMGAIRIDARAERVVRILGAPIEGTSAMQFTGVHVLSPSWIDALPEEGCILRRGYIPWMTERGAVVAARVDRAPFRDCGTVGEYLAAHRDVLSGAVAMPGVTPGDVWIGEGAITRDASLSACVIGAGAVVQPGVRLERCVVWPGTVVGASPSEAVLADAVLADDLLVH